MQNTTGKIKNKHNHKLTDCLKAAIFSLVMLAPIFSIAVRCGYVMLNKNAYESYYGETINDFNYKQITNSNDLKVGETYHFSSNRNSNVLNNSNITLKITDITNFTTSYGSAITYLDNITQIKTTYYTINYLIFFDNNNNALGTFPLDTYDFVFDFVLTDNNYASNTNLLPYLDNYIFKIEYNNYSYLDNAFTYGISNLKNETVFNWTQNTAIYTPIHAMTTGLGITEDAIAIMLTYWALMTAIYIVFDIVIVIFTKITHFLQN